MNENLPTAALVTCSIVLLVALAIWVILMGVTAGRGTTDEQLERLQRSSHAYRWAFVNASLIGPLMVSVLLLLNEGRETWATDGIATAFLGAYLAIITVSYTSQYAVLPALLREKSGSAKLLYFGDRDSLPYFGALLAYAVFGVAAILFSLPLIDLNGTWTVAGWVLLASGVTSVAGFMGYAARLRLLEEMCGVGGFLIVPFVVLVLVGA
ncbi:MAG: hypothetical protein JW722_07890 [Demequinaceae bacterium]|nr:hypothetical protein [Demequinaceae bacterium]